MHYVSNLKAAAYLMRMPAPLNLWLYHLLLNGSFSPFLCKVTLGSSIMKSTLSMTVLADRPIYEIKGIGRRHREKCST